ncbi:hypothetical protein [Mesorhizobium sp. M7A.F.Ca.US.001.02.1.1]|uniref:hypothetical protein n=1 Tax=Mesorhizobium sp. M7A.F.Ca.US.001.02.1.1 TaxID=2496703 RepID=UPI000FD5EBD0|nr:hypothetical protein [Mesorhizobium sp. M7A.F.Ca.US.001.02.1.1]RVA05351.1 hypothetical protein EN938_09755 [Mesorhizobium sp. M7A.F.Ca.US.001.02.1.1]
MAKKNPIPAEPPPSEYGPGVAAPNGVSEAELRARRLRVSINPDLIDKNIAGDQSLFALGWENVELTLTELMAEIGAGVAYCAQLRGRRRAANFLATDVVSVDVDSGMSIRDALDDPIIKENAAFLYTTVSHTPEVPRYRVVFVLPETIEGAEEIRALSRSLALRLGGDMAATDPSRISYGNRSANFFVVGKTLSRSLRQELVDQSVNLGEKPVRAESYRSKLILKEDQPIRRADGTMAPFYQLAYQERVYCPFHDDRAPSAFVLRNKSGQGGLHCSACNLTYWPERTEENDFPDFDAYAKASVAGEMTGPFHKVSLTVGTTVITPSRLVNPVTFVKAPKGTGKTEGLKTLFDDRDKVLLIGHRRLLNRQIADRLGLHSYLDKDSPRPWRGGRDERLNHFAVSVDSISLVPSTMIYDLVIIDESEQVLSHFLSDTIGQDGKTQREVLFIEFGNLLRRAKRVIALDADLGWLTFYTMWQLKFSTHGESPNATVPTPDEFISAVPEHTLEAFFVEPTPAASEAESRLIINELLPGKDKTLEIYASPVHLIGDLMKALEGGKRCLVVSNSKTRIEKIAMAIGDRLPASKYLVVTSETTSESRVQAFIAQPAKGFEHYDVVLASPTMGTGVDITFPDNAEMVDVVFGFCEANITTHFDFDQQLGRVRHPKAVKVWLSPQIFHYETSQDVVRHEILEKNLFGSRLTGHTADGQPINRSGDLLLEMAALSTSQRRASMNKIKANFIRHKEKQGFTIRFVSTDDAQAAKGKSAYGLGAALRDDRYAEQLLAAVSLPRKEFSRLVEAGRRGEPITASDALSIERTGIELFYRERMTRELIAKDERGKLRQKTRLFEKIHDALEDRGIFGSEEFSQRDRFLRQASSGAKALARLLQMTPIFNQSGFRPDVKLQAADLVDFADFVLREKATLENLLDVQMRRDVGRKAAKQLGQLLGLVGLGLVTAGNRNTGHGKLRFYQLTKKNLALMEATRTARKQTAAWPVLREAYGWTLADIDPDDDDDSE